MRKRPSYSSEEKPKQHNRRSFILSNLAAAMAAVSSSTAGVIKMLEESPIPEKQKILHSRELCRMVQEALHLDIIEEQSPEFANSRARRCAMELDCMAQDAFWRTMNSLEGLFESPSEQSQVLSNNFNSAVHWTNTYGVSTNCTIREVEIDCNDYGHRACEIWYEVGYQGHLVNTWPDNAKERLEKPWHQFGTLRIDREKYIIVDNKKILIWNGTLESYIHHKQLSSVTPNSVIPMFGIAEYTKPKHDYPIVKLALTVTRCRGSEEHVMRIEPVADSLD